MAINYTATCVKMRKHILDGLRPTQAAVLSGISRDTYQRWLREKTEFNTFIESIA
jgi:hypothetical protein